MHPDLDREQQHFDIALAYRERQRAEMGPPDPEEEAEATATLRHRLGPRSLTDPDQGVAFGRIDADGDSWYIGKHAVWNDEYEIVVVNWQAPIAAPYYTATKANPEGLQARRTYRCRDNRILDIHEEVFAGLEAAVTEGRPPGPSDGLLDALAAQRAGELGAIVATIQAAQYDVITRDPDQLLVVQGGPGTGKTVVGLHRVSWLLHNRQGRLSPNEVLIVGPNPAFIRYIAGVLPALGEPAAVQLPVTALGPRVRLSRLDPPPLRRLKGDRRMLRVIVSALRNRERVDPGPVELAVGGSTVRLDGTRIAARARQLASRPHNEAYRDLRSYVLGEVRTQLARLGGRDRSGLDGGTRGEAARAVDGYLEQAWPTLTPQSFLVDLFSNPDQLEAAAAGVLTEDEVKLLTIPRDVRVGAWQWSPDDVPLLDAADSLLNGPPATYEHIVVDEAQDLSPMQLESIRRRSRSGGMTLLGDLAQGTSPWAHGSWEEVALHLRRDRVPTTVVELELGYRLPAEVHELAMRLLPATAPAVAAPRAVRPSGHDVVDVADGPDVAEATVSTVRKLLEDGLVGIIVPSRQRARVAAALERAGLAWSPELRGASAPVVLLSAEAAKGLEFDAVVVVEPAQLVAESAVGLRALFIAMTRCTQRLALVRSEPLPPELGKIEPAPARVAGDEPAGGPARPEGPARPGSPAGAAGRDRPARPDRSAPAEPAPDRVAQETAPLPALDMMALAAGGANGAAAGPRLTGAGAGAGPALRPEGPAQTSPRPASGRPPRPPEVDVPPAPVLPAAGAAAPAAAASPPSAPERRRDGPPVRGVAAAHPRSPMHSEPPGHEPPKPEPPGNDPRGRRAGPPLVGNRPPPPPPSTTPERGDEPDDAGMTGAIRAVDPEMGVPHVRGRPVIEVGEPLAAAPAAPPSASSEPRKRLRRRPAGPPGPEAQREAASGPPRHGPAIGPPDTPRPEPPRPETSRPEPPAVRPWPEMPRVEPPPAERPWPETSRAEPPRPETPAERSWSERPRPERPRVEPPAERPWQETPRAERPRVEPPAERPRPEMTWADMGRRDAPGPGAAPSRPSVPPAEAGRAADHGAGRAPVARHDAGGMGRPVGGNIGAETNDADPGEEGLSEVETSQRDAGRRDGGEPAEWGRSVWSDAVPAEPPPGAVDWRKSIPREFVARSAPARELPSRERPAEPAATNGHVRSLPTAERLGGPAPATPGPQHLRRDEPAARRDAPWPAPVPAHANGVNGANGALARRSAADGAGPWSELDREIARAVARTVAGELSRYVNPSLLPLVADELARSFGPGDGDHAAGDGGGLPGER